MIHYNSDCSIFEVTDLNEKYKYKFQKIVKISGNPTHIANESKIMKMARSKYKQRRTRIDRDKYKFNISKLNAFGMYMPQTIKQDDERMFGYYIMPKY